MLAAVAAASLATISGPPEPKPMIPATIQSHHKPPAALACERGDASKKGFVISVVITVYISLRVCGASQRRDGTRLRNWNLCSFDQKPKHDDQFAKQHRLRP